MAVLLSIWQPCEWLESRNLDRMKRTREPRIEHGPNTGFRVPSAFHPWLPPAIGTESTRRREYLGRFKVRSRSIQGPFKVHSRSVQGSFRVRSGFVCAPKAAKTRENQWSTREENLSEQRRRDMRNRPHPRPLSRWERGEPWPIVTVCLPPCPLLHQSYHPGAAQRGFPPQPLKPLLSTTYITCQHVAPVAPNRGAVQ